MAAHNAGAAAWRRRLTPYTFVLPAFAGLGLFLGYPLIAALYFSFTRYSLAVMVPARIAGAMVTALQVNQAKRAGGLYRTLFYLPALGPPVAATLAFVLILKPGTGPVSTFLSKMGVADPPLWFNSPDWAKPSLVLLALDVPKEQQEATSSDGANVWQRFRYVTIPAISPVILFATITGVIATLQYFTQAAVAASVASGQVTGAAGCRARSATPIAPPTPIPLWLYVAGFRYHLLGYASVLSVVLFVVAFENWPVSLGLASFRYLHHVEWHLVSAGTMLTMLPVIVLFFFAQKAFVQGVTLTGVKG